MPGVLIINDIVIISAFILEKFLVKNISESYSVTYENLELLESNKEQKLIKDISELTREEILKVNIRRVDYRARVAVLDRDVHKW